MENKEQIQNEINRISDLIFKAAEKGENFNINSRAIAVFMTELAEIRAEISKLQQDLEKLI